MQASSQNDCDGGANRVLPKKGAIMAGANYYDSQRSRDPNCMVPAGQGRAHHPGGPPAGGAGPRLFERLARRDRLGKEPDSRPRTPAGTFVVAVVKTTNIVPGGVTSFGVLIPDVVVETSPVVLHTIGVVAVHRGVAQLGPGQLETYTEVSLKGTAAHIIMPA